MALLSEKQDIHFFDNFFLTKEIHHMVRAKLNYIMLQFYKLQKYSSLMFYINAKKKNESGTEILKTLSTGKG